MREEILRNSQILDMPQSSANSEIHNITRLNRRNPDTMEMEESFSVKITASDAVAQAFSLKELPKTAIDSAVPSHMSPSSGDASNVAVWAPTLPQNVAIRRSADIAEKHTLAQSALRKLIHSRKLRDAQSMIAVPHGLIWTRSEKSAENKPPLRETSNYTMPQPPPGRFTNRQLAKQQQIAIGQINLRSSLQALDSLLNNSVFQDIDIFLISDRPQKLRTSQISHIQDFIWSSFRESNAWTGILLNKKIRFELLQAPTPFTTTIQLFTTKGPIGLCSFYIKPDHADEALEILMNQYLLASKRCSKLLLAGDSNAHSSVWGPRTQPNRLGLLVEEFVQTAGLIPLTSASTPATFHNAKVNPFWIDVALATPALNSLNLTCSVIEDEVAITDHQLLLTSIPLGKENLPQRTI